MRRRTYDGRDVRRVLAALATDKVVLGRIAERWEPAGLFNDRTSDMVAGWCVNHWRKHGEPPGRAVEGLYDAWAATRKDGDAEVGTVAKLLDYVSAELDRMGEGLSSDYVLDVAAGIFNRARLRDAVNLVEADLDAGRTDDAFGRVDQLRRVELGTGEMVRPSVEYEPWQRAFDKDRTSKPLVTYPGWLGTLLNGMMVRNTFVAWMAPDKVGKSMFLLDAAYRAVINRRRVAFLDVGDMTEEEVIERLGQRCLRRPVNPCEYRWPVGIDDEGNVTWETRREKTGLQPGEAFKTFRRICRKRDLLRLAHYPNSTIGVDGIESVVDGWERDGWVADVVVIDYADILAPPRGVRDPLEQIDSTWKMLRGMSQRLHCLLMTATQSNAAAYKRGGALLNRTNFSGRKTKLAHVNGMIGINQTPEEHDDDIWRLNWVVRRRGKSSDRRYARVAGCLDAACPVVKC